MEAGIKPPSYHHLVVINKPYAIQRNDSQHEQIGDLSAKSGDLTTKQGSQ